MGRQTAFSKGGQRHEFELGIRYASGIKQAAFGSRADFADMTGKVMQRAVRRSRQPAIVKGINTYLIIT